MLLNFFKPPSWRSARITDFTTSRPSERARLIALMVDPPVVATFKRFAAQDINQFLFHYNWVPMFFPTAAGKG